MKTTLIIGTNRLTADLTCDEIIDIFSTFYGRMEASLELPPPITEDDIDSEETIMPDEQPVPAVSKIQQLKLFVFKCPDCLKAFVARKPGDLGTPPNTDIRCNCGTSTRIHSVHKASGECPNCGERFWDMHMINDSAEIVCRKCLSPIDLFRQGDGTLGTKF